MGWTAKESWFPFLAGARDFNVFQDVQIVSGAHPVSDSRGFGGLFAGDIVFGVCN